MRLSRKYLREALDYNPTTGEFRWRVRPTHHFITPTVKERLNRQYAGKIAGCLNRGYVLIKLNGHMFYAHRLAWFYMYGKLPLELDHIDCDRANNRIANLRVTTAALNQANRPAPVNNTSGIKGVYKDKDKFRARIIVNNRRLSLGRHPTLAAAAEARRRAAEHFQGKFARHK